MNMRDQADEIAIEDDQIVRHLAKCWATPAVVFDAVDRGDVATLTDLLVNPQPGGTRDA